MIETSAVIEIVTITMSNITSGREHRFMPGAKTRACRAMLKAVRKKLPKKDIVNALNDSLFLDLINV